MAASHPSSAQSEGSIVVVISPELPAVDVLISEMQADSKIVFFNQAEEPFSLITRALQQHEPVRVLHILTESVPGAMLFQGAAYPVDSLLKQEELLGSWKQHFAEHGDILFYGCELGKGDRGLAFVQYMAILTGLDVAASRDMTGSSEANGDWNLEVRSGSIESRLVVSRDVDNAYTTVLRGERYDTTKKRRRASRSVLSSASVSRIGEP